MPFPSAGKETKTNYLLTRLEFISEIVRRQIAGNDLLSFLRSEMLVMTMVNNHFRAEVG